MPRAEPLGLPEGPDERIWADFLQAQLRSQPGLVQRHVWQGQSLWVKRAGVAHPAWRYRLLAALATWLRLPVLQPVPNPGGRAAIATEVQRLRALAALGLRVPEVLAVAEDGFAMRDLGQAGASAPSLGKALERAVPQGADAVLALWRHGLQAVAQVHAAGACLSQAFARNLVLCPDGVIGFIDFEDDPAAHLPLPLCQVRDALCYAHSTAWILAQAQALAAARPLWQSWLAARPASVRAELSGSVQRLRGLRHLPPTRRWGRDALRLRLAWELLRPDVG